MIRKARYRKTFFKKTLICSNWHGKQGHCVIQCYDGLKKNKLLQKDWVNKTDLKKKPTVWYFARFHTPIYKNFLVSNAQTNNKNVCRKQIFQFFFFVVGTDWQSVVGAKCLTVVWECVSRPFLFASSLENTTISKQSPIVWQHSAIQRLLWTRRDERWFKILKQKWNKTVAIFWR